MNILELESAITEAEAQSKRLEETLKLNAIDKTKIERWIKTSDFLIRCLKKELELKKGKIPE